MESSRFRLRLLVAPCKSFPRTGCCLWCICTWSKSSSSLRPRPRAVGTCVCACERARKVQSSASSRAHTGEGEGERACKRARDLASLIDGEELLGADGLGAARGYQPEVLVLGGKVRHRQHRDTYLRDEQAVEQAREAGRRSEGQTPRLRIEHTHCPHARLLTTSNLRGVCFLWRLNIVSSGVRCSGAAQDTVTGRAAISSIPWQRSTQPRFTQRCGMQQ